MLTRERLQEIKRRLNENVHGTGCEVYELFAEIERLEAACRDYKQTLEHAERNLQTVLDDREGLRLACREKDELLECEAKTFMGLAFFNKMKELEATVERLTRELAQTKESYEVCHEIHLKSVAENTRLRGALITVQRCNACDQCSYKAKAALHGEKP